MSLVKRITIDGTSYDIAPANMDSVPTADSENPISSGGIKSYLESSYVPLSATQAPVTGLTDILTPVNLLPNSDFSRAEGYASSLTFSRITSSTYKYILNSYDVYADNGSISNVTVTRAVNSLTITFTILEQLGTGNSVVYIRCKNKMKANTYYTIGARLLNITDPSGQASFFTRLEGTQSTMFAPDDISTAGEYYARTCKTEADRMAMFGFKVPIASGNVGLTYSFTISDIVCYEGCFKNPPITTSLDVKPGVQFLYRTKSNSLGHASYGMFNNPAGRYRIFKIAEVSRDAWHNIYLEGLLYTAQNNNVLMQWYVRIALTITKYPAIQDPSVISPSLQFVCIKDASNTTNRIPSAQITMDSDYNIYFSITNSYVVSNNVGFICFNFVKAGSSLNYVWNEVVTSAFTNTANTTDTVLKTVNAQIGF